MNTTAEQPIYTNDQEYIVRRLTPKECGRLQGFPDGWCADIEIAEPTEEDIARWRNIFETYRLATDPKSKPKTDAQIKKWLKNPHSDSAEYKMWGNGIALPCLLPMMKAMGDILKNDRKMIGG